VRPGFFIVGAPKAGTSWLYRNLAASREVFLPLNKEPRYFSVEEGADLSFRGPGDDVWMGHFVRTRAEYEALFREAGDEQLCGEASSDYLYRSETAARRIGEEVPDARIVVLLRDPVQRAYSNWLQHMRDGRETLPFAAALNAEGERIRAGWAWWWHYAERGFYSRQLEPFFDRFPAERILVMQYDELRRDPEAVLRRACAFLEVEVATGELLAERHNESLLVRSPLHRAARRVLKPNAVSRALLPQRLRTRLRYGVNRATLRRPALSVEDRARLRLLYAADVERLGTMCRLDLSGWLA
jgi:hypothetical protein